MPQMLAFITKNSDSTGSEKRLTTARFDSAFAVFLIVRAE